MKHIPILQGRHKRPVKGEGAVGVIGRWKVGLEGSNTFILPEFFPLQRGCEFKKR
jgi:hypothetical protein